jgi:hypothetical protein
MTQQLIVAVASDSTRQQSSATDSCSAQHTAGLSRIMSDLGHVFQSQGELAIRTWPKVEMDELVFCLPEKKWMFLYVHWAQWSQLLGRGLEPMGRAR